MKSLKEMREERTALTDRAEKILAKAQREERALTEAEAAEVDRILGKGKEGDANYEPGELARVNQDIDRAEKAQEAVKALVVAKALGTAPAAGVKPRTTWQDRDGKPVQILTKNDRWADLPHAAGSEQLSLGNLIRAMATGNRRFAERELDVMQSMGGNVGSGGGFMVPSAVSATVIDLARAQSAVMRAGAITVPMETDSLTVAKIATDASFVTRTDNQTIPESDMTFGAVQFFARTIGTIVRMSRELAEDAPNAAELVSNALARAFAAELDRQAIEGTGGTELNGLTVRTDITDGVTSAGAISWEDLHTASVAVLNGNYTPSAYIVSPTIYGDLTILTSGDGTNSAKLWLPPPPLVATLTPFPTTNCPDTTIIVGDFSRCAFGIRQSALVEVSRDASDAFTKHSLLIKLTWRGQFNVLQGGAFSRITGITT